MKDTQFFAIMAAIYVAPLLPKWALCILAISFSIMQILSSELVSAFMKGFNK